MSSLQQRLAGTTEIKTRLSSVVLVTAIVFAMSGWIYALGWVAFKLFEFV